MRLIDANEMAANESEAYMSAQSKIDNGITFANNSCVHAKIQKLIADTPTVDAVPVVRCKDCKFYTNHAIRDVVLDPDACHWNADEQPDPDDFCSCGERRVDE